MRRNALCISATLVMAVAVSGCALFSKNKEASPPAFASADVYQPQVQEPIYQPDPYPTYGTPVQVEQDSQPTTLAATPMATTQYHTVVKRDTLYSLARQYYGEARRWRDIYEANATTISDPNKIRVGDRLVIP